MMQAGLPDLQATIQHVLKLHVFPVVFVDNAFYC